MIIPQTHTYTHTTNTLPHTQQTQTSQHNILNCTLNKHPLTDKTHKQQTETLTQQTHTQNQKRLIHCIFQTYIYFACLGVRLYPINVKTAEPIGPNFLWDLMWPQGRFMDNRIFKNLPPSKFFVKIREISVCFCFTMSKREHVHNWNGRIVEIYYIISIE